MTFKDKVIYQIYPKSYKDSNGDGIGDLKGIKEKLPYLNDLGIDMIWLNPIYPSPQKDNGYDISDYTAIDPIFGTMEEFEQLIAEAKKYRIEIMLDMVLNHVSTEHEWFKSTSRGPALSGLLHFKRRANGLGIKIWWKCLVAIWRYGEILFALI